MTSHEIGPRSISDLVKSMQAVAVPPVREVGDIRRNAMLWLSHLAGAKYSTFEVGRDVAIDESRLRELPYLGALGYLAAIGAVSRTALPKFVAPLRTLAGRSAHTVERTGYADDPLFAVGLLLLANELEERDFAFTVQNELQGIALSDPPHQLLVAFATNEVSGTPKVFDSKSVQDCAAAVLASRINAKVASAMFAGMPSNIGECLLMALNQSTFRPTADIGGLMVLSSLETMMPQPLGDDIDENAPCDVAIIVALKEEFRVLFERFKSRYSTTSDEGETYYLFDVPTTGEEGPYRCIAAFIGEMGTSRAGIVAERIRKRWSPAVATLVGIAAGIHDDVRLGDVVIGSQVDNYLEAAKVVDLAGSVEFKRSNDSFKPDHDLMERAKNFEFANQSHFLRWQSGARSRRGMLTNSVDAIVAEDLIRDTPQQREGHIASGPLVVTSKEFISWIRNGDRACLAVEMEAVGLMLVAHMAPQKLPVLVIRGISDFGDDRKSKLDKVGDGVLRRFAMENATDFVGAFGSWFASKAAKRRHVG